MRIGTSSSEAKGSYWCHHEVIKGHSGSLCVILMYFSRARSTGACEKTSSEGERGVMGTDNLLPRICVPPGICIGQGQLHVAQRGERTCVIQLSMPHGLRSYWPCMQMQIEVRSVHGMPCTGAAEFTYTSFTRRKPAMGQLRCVAVPATCAQVCACVDVHVRLCAVWVYLDRCPTEEALAARRVGKPDARLLNQVDAVLAIFFLGVRKLHE